MTNKPTSNKNTDKLYYVKCFFVYAVLGYFFESAVSLLWGHEFDSGIFYGPITPIYGIGIVMVIMIHKYISKFNFKKWKEVLILFLCFFIGITILEQLGGMLIEFLFDKVFWNYSRFRFNWGPYIALEISTAWGLLSLGIVYFLKPLVDKLIKIIPKFIVYILIVLFIINIVFTFIKLL